MRVFGLALPDIARETFLKIGSIARGFAINHHQFRIAGSALVAITSRVKASGVVEIDLGHPGQPARPYPRGCGSSQTTRVENGRGLELVQFLTEG